LLDLPPGGLIQKLQADLPIGRTGAGEERELFFDLEPLLGRHGV